MPSALEEFIAHPDHAARHQVLVRAPASLVYGVARDFDLSSIGLVRLAFWARERMMGSTLARPESQGKGVEKLLAMGWARLVEEPGRVFVAGAVCQPWLADVVFTPIPADRFAAYAEPGFVKIAWTLETEALEPALTRLVSETRVVATDDAARLRFKRYWRWARFGIIGIRLLLMPGMRRAAERRSRRQ